MGPERNMTCLSRVATFLQGQKKKTERKREKKTEEEKEEEEGVEEWKDKKTEKHGLRDRYMGEKINRKNWN